LSHFTRRDFLSKAGVAPLAFAPGAAAAPSAAELAGAEAVELEGIWNFRLDPAGEGEKAGWNAGARGKDWQVVQVPHTWQIAEKTAGYQGAAWYVREFEAPARWSDSAVRVEFEAVYHTATVWLNGKLIGSHEGKGYTAFVLDLAPALRFGNRNVLAVRVDNAFNRNMLPRGDSFDWTMDGGIYRPVRLLVTPKVFIDRIEVDALPDNTSATVDVRAIVRNLSGQGGSFAVSCRIVDDATGDTVAQTSSGAASIRAGVPETIRLKSADVRSPKLWHFDHPNLYRAEVELVSGTRHIHSAAAVFGIRRIEVRDAKLYLNGEHVRLMGVERMAGSNPEYGMAEPASWIEHDHTDMKELNCVFTRVHWGQDRRVLDYCDRHGILMQLEVPSWGPQTFADMGAEPSPEIMKNGLEQFHEQMARDRNHPSVFAWGLCNEVNGQNPAAKRFAQRLLREAKALDPHRLCTYASNSLSTTVEKDVSGDMDFVSWNEYYGSWMKGDIEDMKRNLDAIHAAFPDKMIVISEYGYCECRPEFTGGDAGRAEIMRTHTDEFGRRDYVGGAIFFCYNDYRTHIGDKGQGVLKQRVHGVVDVYGERKPSFEALRAQASPAAELRVMREGGAVTATVALRNALPSYSIEGYTTRCVVYGHGDLPMERRESALPALKPGQQETVQFAIAEKTPRRIRVDLIRPTGFSALTAEWRA
jgi:beta-galactosidase